MSYRGDINKRDRGGAIAAVVAIHAALLLVFLHLSGKIDLRDTQRAFSVLDFANKPPPPPEVEQRIETKLKLKEGPSAPRNIKSKATPIEAPKPRIETPPVQKIVASETPRQGAAATEGSSALRGPGTGAGGAGNGTGAGGNGAGGGGNDVAEPPHLVTPVMSGRDFPRDMFEQWPAQATVFLRLRIDPNGYVAECMIDRGTGIRAIDSMMCNFARERLRFRPALNRNGEAVAGWFGYAQPAPR